MINLQNTSETINHLLRTFRLLQKVGRKHPEVRKHEILFYQLLEKYFTRILNAREEGNFIATHTTFMPGEILYAMDIVPMQTEWTSWILALFTKRGTDFISEGRRLGLTNEVCSAQRGIAGAFSLGTLPRPDAVIWSNLICNNIAKNGELIMEINRCPGFFLDHPLGDSAAERNYLRGEIEDMIHFLEEQTGRKMDWDHLSDSVAGTMKQIEISRQICELRKAVPSPFHPQEFMEMLTVTYLFQGQPEATEYLEMLYEDLSLSVSEGRGAVSPERFRVMSIFLSPIYRAPFLEKFSQEHGMVSVAEPIFTQWEEGKLDPTRPLDSLVQKLYMLPERSLYSPVGERTLKKIVDCAKEYKADGAIAYADVACQHTCALIKLFKDVLNDIDVPLLILDCDLVDQTVTSEEDMREKLEQFLELLEDR